MKRKVEWSREAMERLAETERYIALDSPERAVDFSNYLIDQSELIPAHPKKGRVVPEVGNESIRELLLKNYRLIYRINVSVIKILTVFEGHKLLDIRAICNE